MPLNNTVYNTDPCRDRATF